MNRRSFLKSSAFSLMCLAAVCLGCGNQQSAAAPTAAADTTTDKGAQQTMNTQNKKNSHRIFFLERQYQSCR